MKHLLNTTTNLTAIGYNSDPGTTITLPVGRIVWGHPGKPKPATDQNNQPKMGKDGQQLMETSFGLAIPEADFNASVWPHMHAEASKGYPSGVPGKFSWKITQPTEIDPQGKPYSERTGYAGHVVLAVSTVLEPPGIFRWDGAKWAQMQPTEIKCGDYVQVEVNFKVNVPAQATHTPSLYVNPRAVAFVGYGEEIVGVAQADPNKAFGNGPPPMPAGASATPIGAPANAPGMPGNGSVPVGAGMPAPTTANAGTVAPVASAPPTPTVSGPVRPTEPTYIHDNGNGTEQWFVNGAWDGGAHPVPTAAPAAPAPLPPPATGFVDQAAGVAPAPGGVPPMPGAVNR